MEKGLVVVDVVRETDEPTYAVWWQWGTYMLQVPPMQIDSRKFYSEKAFSVTLHGSKLIYAGVLACDCHVIQYSLTICLFFFCPFMRPEWGQVHRKGEGLELIGRSLILWALYFQAAKQRGLFISYIFLYHSRSCLGLRYFCYMFYSLFWKQGVQLFGSTRTIVLSVFHQKLDLSLSNSFVMRSPTDVQMKLAIDYLVKDPSLLLRSLGWVQNM